MPVSKVNSTITPIQKFIKLKENIAVSALAGDFKGFKENSKILASEGVKDFDSCVKADFLSQVKVPLDKFPLGEKIKLLKNIIKIKILNALRIKTPDEKLFSKLCEKERLRKKIFKA